VIPGNPTSSITSGVAGILAEVARSGLTLRGSAGKVRYRPRSGMTPAPAQRIKVHRSALLADTTPPNNATTRPDAQESRVSSVVSVSERAKHSRGLWSEDELALLARAGSTPADLPLVSAVKDAFADGPGAGTTVISAEVSHGSGGWARRRAAELIRDTEGIRSTILWPCETLDTNGWRSAPSTADWPRIPMSRSRCTNWERHFTKREVFAKMSHMPPIYEEIRQAIAASDKSRYRLWQETSISQGHLCEFMAGTKGLSVESLEKLADCLDLEIITQIKNGKRGKAWTSIKAKKKGS